MSHTILLVQPGKSETRTYSDYESINECMEGVCKIYEEYLKQQNPNTPSITYDISQLFDFIDELSDLSCLVYAVLTTAAECVLKFSYSYIRKVPTHTHHTIKIGSRKKSTFC